MTRRPLAFGIAAAVLLASACAQNIVQVRQAGSGEALAARRVVVAPFRVAQRQGAEPLSAAATEPVSGFVSDSLATRGLDVVPQSDVAQAFGDGAAANPSLVPMARDRFGADAVVTGTVYRFRERSGEAMGTLQPASVGFEVKVFTGDGKLFRSLVFDHTQVALSENALTAAQYPGGGSRWLTAEELARWGAERVVRELPLQAASP
jgi:hypothetical protein